jgi:hypothetical protein
MGAFNGAVQVRSKDRDRATAAAEEVARQRQIHMLIGPVLSNRGGALHRRLCARA